MVRNCEDEPFLPYGPIWTLPPGGKSPSFLAPEEAVGGVVIKVSNVASDWSTVYPFPGGGEGWSKPRLLVEVNRRGMHI